jgi:DNA polymerase III epsilon subunit-like protein
MQDERSWVLIDTETNGISDPIYVVDLAAQKMKGWEPDGDPFQALLNQNIDIPPEASRINGYTREILERDGRPARDVYDDFREYVQDLPIVSYNLEFDLERVLRPEWSRLGIHPVGGGGFCALRLTQRLLDPVPAGNCKLQTLRQFYRLPERGAHSALGDVITVVDLISKVLRPISEERNLDNWQSIVDLSKEEWFPTRLMFGKYKGRSFKDARHDSQLKGWLEWLGESKNRRTRRMAEWYLSRLHEDDREGEVGFTAATAVDLNLSTESRGEARSGIVLFHSVELDAVRHLVTAARERLADLEVIYARCSDAIAVTQAALFSLLKDHYRRRDNLKLTITFRKRFIEALVTCGEEETEHVCDDFDKAKSGTDNEYRQAEELANSKKGLTEDQQAELKGLFRKLVRLFHPDRHVSNPEAQKAYTRLTQEITTARNDGDIEKLREIANDPEAYMRKLGGGRIDLSEETEVNQLRRLYESLQAQILELLESIDELRSDPKYELSQLAARRPNYLNDVAEDYRKQIDLECEILEAESEALALEIQELTGLPVSELHI